MEIGNILWFSHFSAKNNIKNRKWKEFPANRIMQLCENIKIHFLFVCFEKKKSKIKIVYLDSGGKSKNECLMFV